MGAVLKPVGSMFGIGQKDDPTFAPSDSRSGTYNRFADNATGEYNDAHTAAEGDLTGGAATKSLFGQGGLQSQLGQEGQDLSSRGYQLNDQDHEAYGQAAGDISRQFGQQEQDASQALARRGLGGGASGAAGATFSGIQGSKNEMLAKAQTDIAQKRMQDTQQRLKTNREMQQSLGLAGQGMVNSQAQQRFDNKSSALKGAGQMEQGVNDQARQANEDMIGHKSKNIGDAWAEGKYSGTKSGESDATASWMKMGGSSSMGMSDERNKTDVSDGAPKVRSFLQSVSKSHNYDVVPEGKTQSAQAQEKSPQQQSGGAKPPWAAGIQQPNKDGTYTPSASESAQHEQATSGLAGPMQDGSGGMTSGGATPDSGLTSMFGGGGAGAGEAGSGGGAELMSMFSDENDKKDIHDGDPEIRGFLDSVHPHEYEYKDDMKDHPLAGHGKHVSPMAQELEKTELGQQMVHDTPDGKVVDYGKGFGTMMAALGDLNHRLNRQEGKKK